MTEYKVGDHVRWNDGCRYIFGFIVSLSPRSAAVRVDEQYRKPIWPDNKVSPEIQDWHTWSERMTKIA